VPEQPLRLDQPDAGAPEHCGEAVPRRVDHDGPAELVHLGDAGALQDLPESPSRPGLVPGEGLSGWAEEDRIARTGPRP
jgi:hypothetical protein